MSQHVQLKAKKRTLLGNEVRKVRKKGGVPAVIYGNKITPLSIELEYNEFYHAFKAAGKTHVVDLKIEGEKLIPCIVHDIDVHPVSGQPRHVDFLAVNLKEKINAEVPVEIIGEAPAIKEFGAVLNIIHNTLTVIALPDDIPSIIEVNVSELDDMSKTITLSDLIKPDQLYTFELEPETEIVGLIGQSVEQVEDGFTTVVEGESTDGEEKKSE